MLIDRVLDWYNSKKKGKIRKFPATSAKVAPSNTVRNASIALLTTPRSLKPGVNDTFLEYLKRFEIDNDDRTLITKHIEKVLDEDTIIKNKNI